MKTWYIRQLAGGALAAIVLMLASNSAVQAQPSRAIWSYCDGAGTFATTNSPGQWVERTHLGTVYTFTETQRTATFVELYDASRGIWVRLCRNACYIQHSGTCGRFDLLYRGHWCR